MAMECFNSLLLKLREAHEREVEGWQVKIQELSNKKGCDTKRMEELFAKNQQLKEQQRLLTENIKTLENRLRAGLCDRCTVTQEVAKRKQQEFEASQMQNFHHISLLAGEMNNLTKENKRLKDEIKTLKSAFHDHSFNSHTITEVKNSPNLSPPSGPVALITTATSKASNQPADGDVAMKTEVDQKTEGSDHRQWRGMNRRYLDSYKPLSAPSTWKTEHSTSLVGDRRAQDVDGLNHQVSIPSQALLLKNSSSTSGEVNPSRHVLHAPVPCRPRPIKGSHVSLPWSSPSGTSPVMQPSVKSNLSRFPNLIPVGQHDSPRRQGLGSLWHKQSIPTPAAVEPTVLFRLRSLSEHVESQTEPQEIKENPLSKTERVSAEGLREMYEGPLDLSDRGKSQSNQSPTDYSTLDLKDAESVHNSADNDVNPTTQGLVSSPHRVVPASSSLSSPVEQYEEELPSDHKTKVTKEPEQKEEVNGRGDQSSEKKVPVLTISLRPVVVLETLNSALQKEESLSSNDKSSSPAVEMENSMDEQDKEQSVSGQECNKGCKRKRTPVEKETEDTNNIQQERKIKLTVRAEEKGPS